jgi:hypothetical protein
MMQEMPRASGAFFFVRIGIKRLMPAKQTTQSHRWESRYLGAWQAPSRYVAEVDLAFFKSAYLAADQTPDFRNSVRLNACFAVHLQAFSDASLSDKLI